MLVVMYVIFLTYVARLCLLVGACLTALRSVLPRDACLQLLVRWYAVRNAPGATLNVAPRAEFATLCAVLRQLMGWSMAAGGQRHYALFDFVRLTAGSIADTCQTCASDAHTHSARLGMAIGQSHCLWSMHCLCC